MQSFDLNCLSSQVQTRRYLSACGARIHLNLGAQLLNAWQDRQGVIRFTGVSGTTGFDSFSNDGGSSCSSGRTTDFFG